MAADINIGRVVFASGNRGKIRELEHIAAELGLSIVAQSELGIKDIAETGTSFVENALIKAYHAASSSGLVAIADDSGLVVDALQGRPGVYSARFAGADATDDDNIDKLLSDLDGVPDAARTAAFHCAAVMVSPDDSFAPLVAEASWRGSILAERRGNGGFGYDPVFFDRRSGLAAAELSPAQKNERSHRGQALRQLVAMVGK